MFVYGVSLVCRIDKTERFLLKQSSIKEAVFGKREHYSSRVFQFRHELRVDNECHELRSDFARETVFGKREF